MAVQTTSAVAYVLLREREKSISSLGNEYKKIPPNVYQA
jgi:hypothetical protein